MLKSAKIFTLIMAGLLLFIMSTSANPARPGAATRLVAEKHWRLRLRENGKFQTPLRLTTRNIPRSILAKNEATPPPTASLQDDAAPQPPPEAPWVKGIYLTSWMTGNHQFIEKIIGFTGRTEINSVVIDVKDDTGLLSYPSTVALAREIGSGIRKYDPAKVLALLKQHRIYTIARIVVFKDPLLAKKRSDLAVLSSQGGLWRDKLGLCWVDPHNQKVWEYNVGIAKEAARLGFDEIQFDYVRFTSDGPIQYCRYPGADERPKADVIRDFLKFAYQELHPLGVKVSADLFGLTCSSRDDLGIGQILEKVAPHVDIICPMVYPSHYPKGVYNIANPDAEPYKTIFQSLSFAKKRLDALTLDHPLVIRPWLQDFSLRQVYRREQLLAQIKAVRDAGFREFIFWNPGNKYDAGKYRSKEEALREEAALPSVTPLPLPTAPATPAPTPAQTAAPSPVPPDLPPTGTPANPATVEGPDGN